MFKYKIETMELDEMKKLWEKTNKIAEKTRITEEKVIKMLKKSYKGTINSLLNFELLGVILAFPLIGVAYYFYGVYEPILPALKFFKWILICACIIEFFWQLYKYEFLKEINVVGMNMIEVSRKILTYRKYISYEYLITIFFLISYTLSLICVAYTTFWGSKIIMNLIVYYAAVLVLSVIPLFLIYKYLYFNNIKKIQESMSEIEEFQKEVDNEE